MVPNVRDIVRIVLVVVCVAIVLYLLWLLRKPISWLLIATFLAVIPVSLHTLVAAALLGDLVLLASWGWLAGEAARPRAPRSREPVTVSPA